MRFLGAKYAKNAFAAGAPDLRGLLLREGEGGREGEDREGKGKGWEG